MNANTHRDIVFYSFEVFRASVTMESFPLDPLALTGQSATVAEAAVGTDDRRDLEFVNVEGSRDDPHAGSIWVPGRISRTICSPGPEKDRSRPATIL